MFAGIRGRLVLLVLLVFGPALCLNLYFAWARRQSGEAEALAQAARLAKMATENQREELEGTRQLLITVSKISRIRSGDFKRGEKLLKELLDDTSDHYYNLFVLDRMGQVVCDARRPVIKDPKDKVPAAQYTPPAVNYDYYSLLSKVVQLDDLTVRKYPLDSYGRRMGVIFAYPVRNFYGKSAGAVAAVVDHRWFARAGSEISLPDGAFLTIIDEKGAPFTRQERSSNFTTMLPDRKTLELKLARGQHLFEEKGRDGVRRIYALSSVIKSNYRLYWCVGLSAEALYSPVNQIYISSLAILAFSGVMVLLGAWGLASRMIVNPLNTLVRATRSLAQGHLKQRIGRNTYMAGELAELAASFDRMANSIELREAALEKSRKRLADILAIVHEAIISLDEHYAIRFFNPAAQRMFGHSTEDVLGHSIDALFGTQHREELKVFLNEFAMSLDFSRVSDGPLVCQRKSGAEFFAEFSVSKLQIGGETLYTVIIRDITEQKRSAEQKAKWNAELERSNAELEQFAYNVSHDLQEPLRMVASYTRLLHAEYAPHLDQRGQDFITFASDSAARLQRMIHDLLTYARAGRPGLRTQIIDCGDLVQQILADLMRLIEKNHAVITYDELPQLKANETELRQLFQNLLVNAIKFRGEAPPQIHIGCHKQQDQWAFYVRDNGIGLEPRFAERIFGLFQRLHPQEAFEGTGIGLALCRKIVENLGGKIWVESTPGQGATFQFTIADMEQEELEEPYREAAAH